LLLLHESAFQLSSGKRASVGTGSQIRQQPRGINLLLAAAAAAAFMLENFKAESKRQKDEEARKKTHALGLFV
jgi:hypothetical protein